ncbi:uncharacterized protein B0T15DRAFT_494784 [Chaetomium strumarium]|uniref:Uncharacterized protein n=1 Tax=Chaetomium strumarium TaxID=1170767 RepID=A0AAJ0GR16_9PEZI|nr:hypothetical protein B0T15DRAFT_494784 [Chaetomium strumarium]
MAGAKWPSITPISRATTSEFPPTPREVADKMGQFDWFGSIGATPEAVAVLNDQPILFTILLIVLVAVILQCVLLWYIHYATMKPEQKKAKKDKKKPEKK